MDLDLVDLVAVEAAMIVEGAAALAAALEALMADVAADVAEAGAVAADVAMISRFPS